ncbi:hypothetical protein HG530_009221 [Fusarium avenaceum]|nr:hypothetical protein HG530_009221 [Fusarium avenaceum]
MITTESRLTPAINLLTQSITPFTRNVMIEPSSPEFRNQQLNKILKGARSSNVSNIETIQVAFLYPTFHLISNCLWASNGNWPKSSNSCFLRDHSGCPLWDMLTSYGEGIEKTLDSMLLNRGVLLQFLQFLLCFFIGTADDGREGCKELERLRISA